MFLDKTRFPMLAELEGHVDTFVRELDALPQEAFSECPLHTLYNHGWYVFPLIYGYPDPDLEWDPAAGPRLCPESFEIVSRHPQIDAVGFARLLPGCHITAHSDMPPPGMLRAHLGLHVPKHARWRLGDREVKWVEGEFRLFDHGMVHEVFIGGTQQRDVMMLDFQVEPAVKEELVRAAAG